MRKEFGITTLTDEAMSLMKVNRPHDKVITTCYNYSIVTNPKYYQAFWYVPIDLRDTEIEKNSSDVVA